jgi:ribosomal protein S18 acetylase RimI-like enzyme
LGYPATINRVFAFGCQVSVASLSETFEEIPPNRDDDKVWSPGMGADIEVVREVTEELVASITRLLPQLSRSSVPPDRRVLRELVTWPGNRLLVARIDGQIVGSLTLVVFPIPTGRRAWIEDVVVDEAARGQGVGAALTLEAVRLARADGVRTVDLTSRPSRPAAIRLYERLGFRLRDSKVYRLAAES